MPDTSPRPEQSDYGVTISLPACSQHPPLTEWPAKNLIQGVCPACTHWLDVGSRAARVLRARRLIEERSS